MVAGETTGPGIEVVTHASLTWHYVERPSAVEVAHFAERHGLPLPVIEECLSRHQRVGLVRFSGGYLITLDFPNSNRLTRVATSGQANVIVWKGSTGDHVATLHFGDARPVVRLFRDCQADESKRAEVMTKGAGGFLVALLDRLAAVCWQLGEAAAATARLTEEAVLGNALDDDAAAELGLLRREVTSQRRIITPLVEVFARLAAERADLLDVGAPDLTLRRELANRRLLLAAEALAGANETLVEIARALDSAALRQSASANRLLTIVLASLLPVLVLAGLFGQNLHDLPLANDPYAFEYLFGVSALLVIGILLGFRWKRWL